MRSFYDEHTHNDRITRMLCNVPHKPSAKHSFSRGKPRKTCPLCTICPSILSCLPEATLASRPNPRQPCYAAPAGFVQHGPSTGSTPAFAQSSQLLARVANSLPLLSRTTTATDPIDLSRIAAGSSLTSSPANQDHTMLATFGPVACSPQATGMP
jgi:hypothetical protein